MIEKALEALKNGQVLLLYDFDDREGETDFAIRSDRVTPRDITLMRNDGGGLICTAVHPAAAERLALPFASDMLQAFTSSAEVIGEIPYDRKNHSSFSLWVNHRDTFTGITDVDRALTITAIAEEHERGRVRLPRTVQVAGPCRHPQGSRRSPHPAAGPDRALGRHGGHGRDHARGHDLRDAR